MTSNARGFVQLEAELRATRDLADTVECIQKDGENVSNAVSPMGNHTKGLRRSDTLSPGRLTPDCKTLASTDTLNASSGVAPVHSSHEIPSGFQRAPFVLGQPSPWRRSGFQRACEMINAADARSQCWRAPGRSRRGSSFGGNRRRNFQQGAWANVRLSR